MPTPNSPNSPKPRSGLFYLLADIRDELGETWPFFMILTVAMLVISYTTLAFNQGMAIPQKALFGLLMLVHIPLHWTSPLVANRQRWIVPYLGGQSLIVVALTLLSRDSSVVIGVFMAMIGETFGVLPTNKLRWSAALFYLALMAVSMQLIIQKNPISGWLFIVIPLTIFIAVYVSLFRSLSIANDKSRVLLKELETANRQLAEYASQVESLTRNAERQRMARELHDTLSQGVAGLILQLEAVDANLDHNQTERARQITQQAMERARSTLSDARRVIDDLRQGDGTSSEAPASVAAALREEASRFTSATNVPAHCEVSLPPALSPELGENILRTVSEALNNIARHAQAHQVWITVQSANEPQPGISIQVRDDGQGFEPQSTNRPGHYGLQGMEERAHLAGGKLMIDSAPGAGTKLEIFLPLEASD